MAAKKKTTTSKKTDSNEEVSSPSRRPKIELSAKNIKIAIVIAIILGLAYLARGLFVVAFVNGRPVTRYEVIKDLEKQGGAQTLDSIITKLLIRQEADRRGVSVTRDEINAQVAVITENIESQGQTLESVLLLQGLTQQDFEDQVELQLLIEKVLEGEIEVTDEAIEAYLTQNADFLPEDWTDEQKREDASRALKQEQLSTKLQPLLDELKATADIKTVVNY